MTFKKKMLLILAFIFISVLITVLCTGLFNINNSRKGKGEGYDGTLVHMDIDFPTLL